MSHQRVGWSVDFLLALRRTAVASLALAWAVACGDARPVVNGPPDGGGAATGGAPASGGAPATGGVGGTGGTTTTGGQPGSGGAVATGGRTGGSGGAGGVGARSGTGGAAGGSGGAGGKGTPLATPTSFAVEGQLTLKPMGISGGPSLTDLPTTHAFLLHVDPSQKILIASTPGRASRAQASNTGGVHFEASESLYVPLPSTGCGASVTYSALAVDVVGPEQIAGTARGMAQIIQGDVAYSYAAELTFTGRQDHQRPAIALSAVNPLDPVPIGAGEPLPAGATARLSLNDEKVALSTNDSGAGVVMSFAVPADKILRYGATYAVQVQPWSDLSGNEGVAAPTVTTVAAPEVFALDGFEGGGKTVGGADVVDASVLPPISGKRSAAVSTPYSGRVAPLAASSLTVRLPVKTGDKVVRVAVRPFSSFANASTYDMKVRVAAPGGGITRLTLPQTETLTTMLTSGAYNVYLGEVRTLELALPAGTVDEVVFDMSALSPGACGLLPPGVNYLVDDLRVE